MTKKWLIVLFTGLLLSSTTYGHGACGTTQLHAYMISIKDELRLMSSDVKSGDNQAAVKHLDSLISYFEKSRDELPYQFHAQDLKGNELAGQTEDYIAVIDDTLTILKDLELALKENDSNEVKRLFGKIGTQRNIGHRAFKANC